MKRIFTSLFFAAMFTSTVNAGQPAISFSYLEEPAKVTRAMHVPRKHVKKPVRRAKTTQVASVATGSTISVSYRFNAGARPGKWCGWHMRRIYGGGAEYNRARLWANRGVSAGGPRVGAVVVWPHHVGVIVGRASNGKWMVHSGNDSKQVKTRARSVAGAIAFRML